MKQLLEKYLSVVRNFIPEKEKVSSVGLDIGTDVCKLIELIKDGDSYEILSWGVEPISGTDTAGAVKNLLAKLSNPSASPGTAVFGKGTLIRYIEMPRMSLEDLKKSFALEADKYFPFPADQIYTDCFILDPKGKDNKMSVLVAAAKKEIINERVQLLTTLGLQTSLISVNPLAIANVFSILGPKKSNGTPPASEEERKTGEAILDMGGRGSHLMILYDNLPRFNRDIFIGGQELTKRISNIMGISLEEAHKLKIEMPTDKREAIFNASESVLMSLISEIRVSFDYFITEKNIPITKLYLTGGPAMMLGLVDFISKNLDIPVELWNPIANMKLADGISQDEINKNVPWLGVAAGLALYQND